MSFTSHTVVWLFQLIGESSENETLSPFQAHHSESFMLSQVLWLKMSVVLAKENIYRPRWPSSLATQVLVFRKVSPERREVRKRDSPQ